MKTKYGVLDNIFEPAIVVNGDLEIIYSNNYLSIFTQNPPRVLKKMKTVLEIFKGAGDEITDFLKKAVASNVMTVSKEIDFDLNNEMKNVVLKVVPFEDNFLICLNDVSVEKQLHDKYIEQVEQLKQNHGQILQADKLTTLGELTAGISHEISNPLTIAHGNIEVIEMVFEGEPNDLNSKREVLEEANENIRDSVARIRSIVSNMKEYLHKSEDKKEYHRYKDIVDASIKLVSPGYDAANIKISCEIEDELVVGLVNRIKIEQVLVNLLQNSLDALIHSDVKNPHAKVIMNSNLDEKIINLFVVDNGTGIPKDVQESIFELFFTTKDVGEGTGIGLSISSKIVSSHHGELLLNKSDDNGTSFQIQLPALEVSSYANNEKFFSGLEEKEGKKILVVDNEVEVLNVLNKFFEDEGYVFIGSNNAPEALRFLNDFSVDMIITDYEMPLMNGSLFSEKIREQDATVPILYLTSDKYIDQYNKDKKEYNLTGLIMKPFSKDQIINTIKMAFGEA